MDLEILIAVVFLFLIVLGALVSAMGWMQASDKLYKAQEQNKKYMEENRKLRAMLAFYKTEKERGGND